MNALREAEGAGMTLEAIVERVMTEKGLDPAAAQTIRRVTIIALKQLQKRVIVDCERASGRWAVKP